MLGGSKGFDQSNPVGDVGGLAVKMVERCRNCARNVHKLEYVWAANTIAGFTLVKFVSQTANVYSMN